MKKDRDPSEKIENKSIYELSEHITYYRKDDDNPEHDTKLAPSEAITAAIRRQKNIKRTQLPLASVYYNHRFIGCVIKKLHGISIHKLMWLPMSAKIKIINSVIDDLDELMQNHVYHRDLSNSPFAGVSYINENGEYIYENGHSHVLVNPLSLKTNIIDLDGKSTIYTERDNNTLKEQCIRELLVIPDEVRLDPKKFNVSSNSNNNNSNNIKKEYDNNNNSYNNKNNNKSGGFRDKGYYNNNYYGEGGYRNYNKEHNKKNKHQSYKNKK
jgi:hypothetical protein